jgi:hypothetical protein
MPEVIEVGKTMIVRAAGTCNRRPRSLANAIDSSYFIVKEK